MATKSPTFIPVRIVKQRIPLSTAGIYRHIASDPEFPKPVRIGRKVLFVESEIDAYIQARLAARTLTK